MTKPKVPKTTVEAAPQPEPIVPPTLSITEEVANEFIKEVNVVQPLAVDDKAAAKAEKFIDSLAKAVKVKPAPKLLTPKMLKAPDDPDEKAKVIAQIVLNANSFHSLLKDHLLPSKEAFLQGLPKRGLEDLTITLKTIERTRTVSNLANQLRHVIVMACGGVELLSSKVGLKSQGFTDAVKAQDDEVRMILKEIAMERADSFKKIQTPEMRLAMVLATTLIGVDAKNRLTASAVNAKVVEASSDL